MHTKDLQLIPKQYRDVTLQSYLDELFGYYERYEPEIVEGVGAPTTKVQKKSFEESLAQFGLTLNDVSFHEIIHDDVQTILSNRGFMPCNNGSYKGIGGIA